MMIIAIAFFALRPSFAGVIRANQERTVLRQLVGLFTSARTAAVARGKLVRVVFEPGEEAFSAEIQSEPEEDLSLFDPLPLPGSDVVRIPGHLGLARFQVGGSAQDDLGKIDTDFHADAYFYPDGRTDGVIMVLEDLSGKTIQLEVSAATGRVRIRE
jgi:hypothetical protein